MKGTAVWFTLALMLSAGGALAETRTEFERGMTEAVLPVGGALSSVNLTLPVNCHVLNATFRVSGLPDAASGEYPESVTVLLNGTEVWRFDGAGCGALGRQRLFSDGRNEASVKLPAGGGNGTALVRLPAAARVREASAELELRGAVRTLELGNFSNDQWDEQIGYEVSAAGDLNGDGCEDFAVGAIHNDSGPGLAGGVYVFFGAPELDLEPDLFMLGENKFDYFGFRMSPAGDVNADGHDDLLVGAPYNSSVGLMAGRAYVFFGGEKMDTRPDLKFDPPAIEYFGYDVAGVGDFNGDGYDDILVGAPASSGAGPEAGAAYLYLGGERVNSTADLVLTGEVRQDRFGYALSGAGDVNGDGFDDVVVGAPFADGVGNDTGRAYLFLGGDELDGKADAVMHGEGANDNFGLPVSDAGDVNGDGYGDVIVSALSNDGNGLNSGKAYIHFGGKVPNGDVDVVLPGPQEHCYFGYSCSGAGDADADGYSDLIVSSPNECQGLARHGCVRLFLGGSRVDGEADVELRGPGENDSFGWVVEGLGDLNADGYAELGVGAPFNDSRTYNCGMVHVYERAPFLSEALIRVGEQVAWRASGPAAGRRHLGDLAGGLNEYLSSHPPSGTDGSGNPYIDVPLVMGAAEGGEMLLKGLNVTYDLDAEVADLSALLNDLLAGLGDGPMAPRSVTVPVAATSSTPGRVRLHGLNVTLDLPPEQVKPIGWLALEEDTANASLLDIQEHFRDDYESSSALRASVVSCSPPLGVDVSVRDNRYLSVDASGAPNWTGLIDLRLRVSDSWGSCTDSSDLVIEVQGVNDPPLVTSTPPAEAVTGFEYSYQVRAVDGDEDLLTFSLAGGPKGMSIDGSTALLSWVPSSGGSENVSIAVSDGRSTTYQNFTLTVTVLNKAPAFVSQPPTSATAGLPYAYDAEAVDIDGDRLSFGLMSFPTGMVIDNATGKVTWTPDRAFTGNATVVMSVSDGRGEVTEQAFRIEVGPFLGPSVHVDRPRAGQSVSGKFIFRGTAARGTLEVLSVQVRLDGGPWHEAVGNASWAFGMDTAALKDGEHRLEARAFDGTEYSDAATVGFRVSNAGGGAGWHQGYTLASMVIAAAVAAALLLHWRKKPRTKSHDWGPLE